MPVTIARKPKTVRLLYETDFPQWAAEQARAIREGRSSAIDWDNVAEEIESLGRRDRRALENRIDILIAHLLKYRVQPERRTRSWDATIRKQRGQVAQLIERNPGLKAHPEEYFGTSFARAVRLASRDTGLDEDAFPRSSPFTLHEVFDPDFLPGSEEGKGR